MACYSNDFTNNVRGPLVLLNQGKADGPKRAAECAANDAGDALGNLGYNPKVSVHSPNRPRPPIYCYANDSERHYRSDLNNIANKYRLKLQYEDKRYGPPHDCYWTSAANINEVLYGSGQSRDKGGAREIASKEAVEALEREGYTI